MHEEDSTACRELSPSNYEYAWYPDPDYNFGVVDVASNGSTKDNTQI